MLLDDTLAIKAALGVLSISCRAQAGQAATDTVSVYRDLRTVLTTLEQQDPDLAGKAGFALAVTAANASVDALFGAASATKPDGFTG